MEFLAVLLLSLFGFGEPQPQESIMGPPEVCADELSGPNPDITGNAGCIGISR